MSSNMGDEINKFQEMIASYSRLLEDDDQYWEFWVLAKRIMSELNDQFKKIDEAKKIMFPEED